MLNRIIRFALEQRLLVAMLSVGLLFSGLWAFDRLPIDAFPDTSPILVQVNTVAPALGPQDIEMQVTYPIEQALGGLPRLARGAVAFEVRPLGRHLRVRRRRRCASGDAARARKTGHGRFARNARSAKAPTRPDRHRLGRSVSLHREQRSRRRGQAALRPDRAAHDAPLAHQEPASHRGGRGRGQHLGRLRKAVPCAVRPLEAGEIRPYAQRCHRFASHE